MATSQNGWPVNPSRTYRQVPGSTVHITVADGPAGDVLMHVAREFDRRVEDIDWKSSRGEFDDWGWADRPIRGSNQTSNHASATAIDLNATRHPLGARNTFTDAQVDEIHRILAEVDGTVRWGGDYTGRADEMHFEINANYARVKAVADRLTGGGGAAPGQEDDMELFDAFDEKKITARPGTIGHALLNIKQNAHGARAELAGLRAAVGKLADVVATGGGASAAELKAAVAEAIQENIVTVDIDVTGPEGQSA